MNGQGVTYTIWHPASQLSNDANGNGVLAAWGEKIKEGDDEATIKRKVEEEIHRISPETTWRWQPDGGLYTFQRLPGKWKINSKRAQLTRRGQHSEFIPPRSNQSYLATSLPTLAARKRGVLWNRPI